MERPFIRGMLPHLGDENDHHGYERIPGFVGITPNRVYFNMGLIGRLQNSQPSSPMTGGFVSWDVFRAFQIHPLRNSYQG